MHLGCVLPPETPSSSSDLACNLGSHGHNKFVKSVHGLGDPTVDRLPDFLNSYFLVQNNLHRSPLRHRERDGLI